MFQFDRYTLLGHGQTCQTANVPDEASTPLMRFSREELLEWKGKVTPLSETLLKRATFPLENGKVKYQNGN